MKTKTKTKVFVRSCMFWNKPVTNEPITICIVVRTKSLVRLSLALSRTNENFRSRFRFRLGKWTGYKRVQVTFWCAGFGTFSICSSTRASFGGVGFEALESSVQLLSGYTRWHLVLVWALRLLKPALQLPSFSSRPTRFLCRRIAGPEKRREKVL